MSATLESAAPSSAETETKRYRLGWIGCGARGSGYPMHLRRLGYPIELVAAVDARDEPLDLAIETYGNKDTCRFRTAEAMLDAVGSSLDGVIVASPNFCHAEHAIAVFGHGLPLLLEKPIAISLDQLAGIWAASRSANHSCVIGFTLRYTPFYRKVRSLIQDGALGQIQTVHAEELMSDRLTSLYSRGKWRPDLAYSGGLLLEKCCHDLDILAFLTGSKIGSVHSFARRSFLNPIPEAADNCGECRLEPDCRFAYRRILSSFQKHQLGDHFDRLASQDTDMRCVYKSGLGYPDHQTLNLTMQNGILATFAVSMAQPRNERTISIQGTEGRLYGEFERGVITLVKRVGPNDEEREEIHIQHDGSGHGGGDTHLVRDFVALMNGDRGVVRASLRDAIEASAVCLAADRSVLEGRTVSLAEYSSAIFDA